MQEGAVATRAGGGTARQPLEILYRDDACAVVAKPAGLLVHPTPRSPERDSVLRRARQQLGCRVYPVHRLDRATSGVLLLALAPEAARDLCLAFRKAQVAKVYRAVVRGFAEEAGVVDYPLKGLRGNARKPAVTAYRRLATVELPVAVGRYMTARYSLVEAEPLTGRLHQIRRHFAHLRHPLIGDTVYGEGRHNRLFRERFGVRRLLLWAARLTFVPPGAAAPVTVCAPPDPELGRLSSALGWSGLPPPEARPLPSSPGAGALM